jgi:hypothetical protein
MSRDQANHAVVRVTPTELAALQALRTPFTSGAAAIRKHLAEAVRGEKLVYSDETLAQLVACGAASYPVTPGEDRSTHYSVLCSSDLPLSEISAFAKANGTTFSGLVRQCLLTIRSEDQVLRAEETRLLLQMAATEKVLRRLEGQLDAVALKLRALAQQTVASSTN